jgi:hypothetical protein
VATDQTSSGTTGGSSSRPATAAEQRATEHAGTTDPEVLARDIAQTREELAVTIDAIVDRVSPKKVVERGKQQAREGVADATELVKGHATTAAGVVKEKAIVASGVVKEKVAEVKEKVSGGSDAPAGRSPVTSATSARVTSAAPVAAAPAGQASSPGASPLPAGTVSVDAGALPPPEPGAGTGSLADTAETARPGAGPAGADLPSHRPVATTGGESPVPPVYAGAGAALLAVVLLVVRRRRARRRRLVSRR